MRFRFTGLLGLLWIYSLAVNAQTYQPVGIENAHWFMYSINQDYSANHHAYVVRGDTTIDNTNYKKLYYQDLGNGAALSPPYLLQSEYLWGVVRDDEDERKVYVRSFAGNDPGYCSADQEHLLYDFSASVGDTIIPCLALQDYPYIVDSIYNSSMYGQTRRAMYTNQYSIESMIYEGIGSYGGGVLSTPDYLPSVGTPDFFYLYDYCIGSDEDCNVVVTSTTSVHPNPSTISVFPNPSFGEIKISWEKPIFSVVQILDATGREMQTISIDPGTSENTLPIDLSMLPPGMYLIRFWADTKPVFQEEFVVLR